MPLFSSSEARYLHAQNSWKSGEPREVITLPFPEAKLLQSLGEDKKQVSAEVLL